MTQKQRNAIQLLLLLVVSFSLSDFVHTTVPYSNYLKNRAMSSSVFDAVTRTLGRALRVAGFPRWLPPGMVALALAIGAAPLAWGQALELHAKFPACESCSCQTSEPMELRLAPGQVLVKLHIEHWTPTNHTGYPPWLLVNARRRNGLDWTGWSESLVDISELRIEFVRGALTPEQPKPGDIVLFESEYQVNAPIDVQFLISSQRYYDGSGACNQAASEHWLSVTTGPSSGAAAPTSTGRQTSPAIAGAAALPGTWAWVSGQQLVVHAIGSCEVFLGGDRINECNWVGLGNSRFRLTHRSGGWVDEVTLSADGRSIDGINNVGYALHGTRTGAAAPLAGRWNWVAGQTLVVFADGRFDVFEGANRINDGQWIGLGGARFRLTHRNGGWVDMVTVAGNGQSIDGSNNRGNPVHGTRQ